MDADCTRGTDLIYGYLCSVCPHRTGSAPAMRHHRWVEHRLKGDLAHLRVGIDVDPSPCPTSPRPSPRKPAPPVVVAPERAAPVTVTVRPRATMVKSGLERRPVDLDAIRARSGETTR